MGTRVSSFFALVPCLDGVDDLSRRVFLDVVPHAVEEHGGVAGEEGLEALALLRPEGDVRRAPDDERRPVAQPGQAGLDLGEVRRRGTDLAREDRDRQTVPCPQERPAVHGHHLARYPPPPPEGTPEDDVHEHVAAHDQEAADRPGQEAAEALEVRIAGDRPRPAIADDEPAHALRAPAGEAEADRPAPVLDHERDPVEPEGVDEALDHLAVLARREAVAGWRLGQAEAGVVGSDATVAVGEPIYEMPIEERPGGVAVQHEERLALAGLEVVHAGAALEVDVPILAVHRARLSHEVWIAAKRGRASMADEARHRHHDGLAYSL